MHLRQVKQRQEASTLFGKWADLTYVETKHICSAIAKSKSSQRQYLRHVIK